MSSMLISMLISMLLLSSMHCDSYIKALVAPPRKHQKVSASNLWQRIYQEFQHGSHRIVCHGDSNSEEDSEESFDHGTEASD